MSDESIKNNSEQNTPKSAENTENEDFVDINSSSEDEVVFHGTIRETQNNSDTLPEEQDTVPKKIKASKKRIVTNTVCIVLACIMIIAGSGFIVVFSIFSRVGYAPINNTEDEIKSSSQVSKQNSQINNHTYEGKLLNDQQILNILLIGADTRYNATSGNSDTMILLSIDTKNKKIKLLSLLRDTYIAIPGYEGNKLNAPFAFSGAELTVKTIQLNYGIQIDRYAIVDFYSFKEIIDSIGGLDIDLTEEEIDYINWQCWKNNQVKTRHELTDKAGKVHLNGRQALWYARDRGDVDEGFSGSDFDRTARQRKLPRTIANNMRAASITQIVSIVNEVGPLITTNLKKTEITTLVSNSLTYLSYQMIEYRLPSDGNYDAGWHYGMSTLDVPDWNAERKKLAIFVYEELVTDALDGYMTYQDWGSCNRRLKCRDNPCRSCKTLLKAQ